MESNVKLLVLEEPTIGVDVGAKAEISRVLELALSNGPAVLLISSDFEEVERVCHRALVFSQGSAGGGESPRGPDRRRIDGIRVGGTSTARHGETQ